MKTYSESIRDAKRQQQQALFDDRMNMIGFAFFVVTCGVLFHMVLSA